MSRATPDGNTHVVIVGAYGSAGVAAASELADVPGVELTLIDGGDPGGGLCILRGCMPSKEVLSAAAHRYRARVDDRLDGSVPAVDLDTVVETKNEHTANFAVHRRESVHRLAERENVEFIRDTARFVDDHTIAAGGRELAFDYVVVATGSTVTVPDLPGIEDVPYTTSADVLDATSLPDSGIVMGFGYVGLELVPYLVEAGGMDLTVIEHDERPLDEADPAFGDELLEIYRRDFDVDVLTSAHERSVTPTDDGVRLTVEREGATEAIEADRLFLFTGRRPNLSGLGLEHTNLEPGPGWVSDTMQAVDDSRTFVVGDANGREPILHVAKEEGFAAAKNVLRHARGEPPEPYENRHHHVVFSGLGVYPYARVGHSEASADAAGVDYVSVTRRAEDDGVFETKDVPHGLAQLVVDAADGAVLGYQGLHYDADVMAKTMQVIIDQRLDVFRIPDRSYHPTTPELLDGLFRKAADALTGSS